mgnify:CR=1 FL=1
MYLIQEKIMLKQIIASTTLAFSIILPAQAQYLTEFELDTREHQLTYCYGYDQGLSKQDMIEVASGYYLDTARPSFWNMAGYSALEQSIMLALITNEAAILNYCPRHASNLEGFGDYTDY